MKRHLASGLLAVALVSTVIGQERSNTSNEVARIRNGLITSSPAWVAQEVTFYVELMSSTLFSGTPRFDLPEVPGVILMKVEGRPVLGTEEINGESWSVQRHEFRVYAHRQGRVTIPSFPVLFSVAPAFGSPPQKQRSKTDAMSFESRLPPGAEGVPLLVSTSKLNVTETWDPELDQQDSLNLQVGDAVTRTVAMQATDVPGMALPPIVMTSPEGMAAYPKSPAISDVTYRGDLTGNRTESVTFVCERPGMMTIPGLVITWWDVGTSELHQVTLPSATINVSPSQVTSDSKSETTTGPATSAVSHRRWIVFASLFTAIAIAFWLFRKPITAWLEARRQRQAESENAYYERVQQACHTNQATAAFNALMAWIDRTTPSAQANTLESFSRLVGDAKLSRELDHLQLALIGREKNWNGQTLCSELNRIRQQRQLQQKTLGRRKTLIPGLNPADAA